MVKSKKTYTIVHHQCVMSVYALHFDSSHGLMEIQYVALKVLYH